MANTTYYWQGGRKIEIEYAGNVTTIQAEEVEDVERAASDAGIEIKEAKTISPSLVRVEIARDRDYAMDALRKTYVVHHVYATKGQPDNEILITDTFFLKFRENTSKREINDFLEREHLEVEEIFGEGSFLVRVTDGTGRNGVKVCNSASLQENVEYAEPNLVRRLTRFDFIPTDPLFTNQWHLHAPLADVELAENAGISAPGAWEESKGIRDVVVAVADDGFDLTHPDFQGAGKVAGRLNVKAIGVSGLDYDDSVHPRAGDYHGTPCAGVAVAEQNGVGTSGVAPGCALLAVRFPLTITDAQLASMFEKISSDADVVSCSWGYGPADVPMASTLRDKITQLVKTGGRRGKGLVFCVAAGNNNCPIKDLANTEVYEYLDANRVKRTHSGPIDRWVAAHPDVITVTASTSEKKRSAYSSWGAEVNVCAPSNNFDDLAQFQPPGRGVWTTDNEGFGPGSDFTLGSRYTGKFGGTSSATPTVAGVCGLVISRNTSLTALQVRELVQNTADKDLEILSATPVNVAGDFDGNGFSRWFGFGKVNAASAVAAAVPDVDQEIIVDHSADDVPIEIPDAGETVLSQVEISSAGVVNDIRVFVHVKHTYIGDLRIDLVAPDGTAVTLHNHEGGATNDLAKIYGPQTLPVLTSLLGKHAQGTWSLRVVDTWFWDQGTLEIFRLAARVATKSPNLMPRSGRKTTQTRASKRKTGSSTARTPIAVAKYQRARGKEKRPKI
ncbi:MAG: S8 family serine peptidase [bacterium]|nr:S8 family serine peptidase [bacterium]